MHNMLLRVLRPEPMLPMVRPKPSIKTHLTIRGLKLLSLRCGQFGHVLRTRRLLTVSFENKMLISGCFDSKYAKTRFRLRSLFFS